MAKTTALDKVLAVMQDGEARSVSRIYYLTGVSPTTIRKAIHTGDLIKVGEDPNPAPPARQGQAIVVIAAKHTKATCPPCAA